VNASTVLRALALPVLAAAAVSGVLGVQVAHGGGDFTPAKPADPCAARRIHVVTTGIEGLGERLVLLGLDGAACRLGVTREALTLDLATQKAPTTAQVNAVRAGLLGAVKRMQATGTLPPASNFTDEALDQADLPGFVKTIIKALPDSVINGALKTDDVLVRTINGLDLRTLLSNLNDPDELNRAISAAVTKAVKDALIAKLKDLACQHLPAGLGSLFCE
jgi:hypothetical protein